MSYNHIYGYLNNMNKDSLNEVNKIDEEIFEESIKENVDKTKIAKLQEKKLMVSMFFETGFMQ